MTLLRLLLRRPALAMHTRVEHGAYLGLVGERKRDAQRFLPALRGFNSKLLLGRPLPVPLNGLASATGKQQQDNEISGFHRSLPGTQQFTNLVSPLVGWLSSLGLLTILRAALPLASPFFILVSTCNATCNYQVDLYS